MDNWSREGGPKISIFVQIYYIKNVHRGRWVVKKSSEIKLLESEIKLGVASSRGCHAHLTEKVPLSLKLV